MKCIICKQGETHAGRTTVTLQRGTHVLVFRNVPAQICENCGEYFLSEETAAALYHLAEDSIRRGAEVEIRQYVAANPAPLSS